MFALFADGVSNCFPRYVTNIREPILIVCELTDDVYLLLFDNFIEDIVTLKKLGLTPLLVHGGGLGIKKKLDESNIESKFIMGLRVTDQKIVKVVEEVMIELNKEIINNCKQADFRAILEKCQEIQIRQLFTYSGEKYDSAKGKLEIETFCTLLFLHSAITLINPPGASRFKVVFG